VLTALVVLRMLPVLQRLGDDYGFQLHLRYSVKFATILPIKVMSIFISPLQQQNHHIHLHINFFSPHY